MYNNHQIIGNLGDNPKVRYTQSNTPVANFSVATSNKYKKKDGEKVEETEWHRCVAWDRTAEIVQEYLSKGSKVFIEGKSKTKKWTDKDGNEKYSTEIHVKNLIMLGGDKGGNNNQGSSNQSNSNRNKNQGNTNQNNQSNDDFDPSDISSIDDIDDDMPF